MIITAIRAFEGNLHTAIRAFEGNLHTAIRAFEGNLHDRQTIQPLWEQHESIVGQAPKELVVD